MKRLFLLFNLIILFIFFYKQKQIKEQYEFSMIDIESEEDILDKKGLYKDESGKLLPVEELFE